MDAGRVTSAALSGNMSTSKYLTLLLCHVAVLTEAMGEHIAGGHGRFLSSAMQPILGECLEDFDEAASETFLVDLAGFFQRELHPDILEPHGCERSHSSDNPGAQATEYHSWRKTCESWERRHKSIPLADKYGLILTIACGSEYGWYSSVFKSISGWNAGICCTKRQDIDDVEYTRIIIKREDKNNLPVYGYGYSNGGMMVESLLCHKVIQMAVSVNGVLALKPGLNGTFETCDDIYNNATFGPKPPVPRVASIHCLDDEWVPYNGSLGYLKARRFLSTYFATNLLPRTNRDIGAGR
ncbi:hypothetical protein FOZ61_000502, partial [Perkinsus olseni]